MAGRDIDCLTSLGKRFTLVGGRLCTGNRIGRRLQTPKGFLGYLPDDGLDLRDFLSMGNTQTEIAQAKAQISAEVERDDEVQRADVDLKFDGVRVLIVKIECETDDGPITLILRVDDLTTAILELS